MVSRSAVLEDKNKPKVLLIGPGSINIAFISSIHRKNKAVKIHNDVDHKIRINITETHSLFDQIQNYFTSKK
jgi:hypothetical protein